MTIIAIIAIIIGLALAAAFAVRAIGGNIALVDDWKLAFNYYSSWGMLFVAMMPDLWNGLLSGGYIMAGDVPQEFSWAIKLALAGTFILKQINQTPRPKSPFGKR